MDRGNFDFQHYSKTQIAMFMRCPYQYYLRYCLGTKIPPKTSMVVGSAVHEAVEMNMLEKRDTGKQMKPREVAEIAVESFERRLSSEDVSPDMAPGEAKDATADAAEEHTIVIAPTIEPVLVEEQVVVDIGAAKPVVGYIDIYDSSGVVRDTKVVQRKLPDHKVHNSLELGIYALAVEALDKIAVSVAYDSLVIRKHDAEAVTMAAPWTEERRETTANAVRAVIDAIEAEKFYPNFDSVSCNPKSCGYWDLCHKHWSTSTVVF